MKINGYKITLEGNRAKLTRGTRHHYLTRVNGTWRQTTKDGAPAIKKIPGRDFEAIVGALAVSGNN